MLGDSHPLIRYLDSLEGPADLVKLEALLDQLAIGVEDLAEHLRFDDRAYARNLVKRTDWYELLALGWKSGQSSPIHDHFGSSCAFRIIEGRATEVNFEVTGPGKARETDRAVYDCGDVCVSSSGHVHQVLNIQPAGHNLVTLHIYSPPLRMGIYKPDPAYHDSRSFDLVPGYYL